MKRRTTAEIACEQIKARTTLRLAFELQRLSPEVSGKSDGSGVKAESPAAPAPDELVWFVSAGMVL